MMTNKSVNNIGVFTSGGDAPGMNAALRMMHRARLISLCGGVVELFDTSENKRLPRTGTLGGWAI